MTATKERHSLRTVSDAIARRVEFDCNGTLSGDHHAYETGRLPREHGFAFVTASEADDFYVVRSYATPIAWFANGQWTVPAVKYSPTTSRHMAQVRKALR